MISVAVGIGLILNFIFLEFFGLSMGGIVVPGFMAMELHQPQKLFLTTALSIVTYLIVRLLSNFMLIYGRRHLIVAILLGFLLSEIATKLIAGFKFYPHLEIVGFILPGIIAYWMERQGVMRTLCAMTIGTSIIHLLIIIITGGRFAI